jgi:hypothetical protein
MGKHGFRALLLTFGHVLRLQAAPGALLPEQDAAATVTPLVDAAAHDTQLTAQQLGRAVADALAKRRILLTMHDLRLQFNRDASGSWFLHITNFRSGCSATEAVGSFDQLSEDRVRSLEWAVLQLVERSRCGVLTAEAAPLPPPAPKLTSWVRPAGAVYAGASAALLVGLAATEPPNLSLSFSHTPSALISSAFITGFAGGTATLFVPDQAARPMLELTVFASTALQALAVGLVPEQGVQAFGEFAVAGGYALSTALVGADWALSSPAAMLQAASGATEYDVPRRALSPWLVYAPATIGAVVSVSRAFDPDMAGADRELAAAYGAYALVPAVSGLVLGVLGSRRSVESETPEPWIAGGPFGSVGLTVGGSL